MTYKGMAVASYDFKAEDELFLDANVWMFVYGPQKPDAAKAAVYSQALARILVAKCRIYIDLLVVSEFINTYARLKWKLVAPHIDQFKAFRKSPDFKPIAQDIAADVKRVLNHCSRLASGFEVLDANNMLDEYAEGGADFNDQVIAALCKSKGLKLVTDDGDFSSREILIVTANKRLLG